MGHGLEMDKWEKEGCFLMMGEITVCGAIEENDPGKVSNRC